MSTFKRLIIACSAVIITGAALIIYSLSPTVKNVSDEPALTLFLNKRLEIKTPSSIIKCEKGQYDMIETMLVPQNSNYPGKRILELKVGSGIIIRQFKTYTNNLGSGFTTLYALGDYQPNEGAVVQFAYDMGTVEKELYSKQPYTLSLTVWQDSTSLPIRVCKK